MSRTVIVRGYRGMGHLGPSATLQETNLVLPDSSALE